MEANCGTSTRVRAHARVLVAKLYQNTQMLISENGGGPGVRLRKG